MKTPQIGRSALRGRRGIVLLVTGVLASGLSVGGIGAVLARGSSSPQTKPDPIAPTGSAAPAVVTHPDRAATPAEPSTTVEPRSDPTALADGVYPTFVRAVDVQGATVTVDVLQVFVGSAAHQAVIEDGVAWRDVQYNPVYIRNENPLLRTLPVARDVQIEFIAMCMSPSRWVGLTELRKQTAHFDELYYYEISVIEGSVVAIEQKVAISAC